MDNGSLSIAYLSPDFRSHPVAAFIESVLTWHDRRRFRIYCYSDVAAADPTTERIRSLPHEWRKTRGISDDQVADLLALDGVQILVDLCGHTADNRLLLFGRRAAPIQVTYIGYPCTTGLSTMDYKVTDAHHDPEGTTEHHYTEQLVRLSPCAWCFRPTDEFEEVGPPPVLRNGLVTFGSLNRLPKVTESMVSLWARILAAVPNSKMLVLVGDRGEGSELISQRFAANGIDPSRLTLAQRMRRRDFLRLYDQVDVMLDTFPYNGQATTCDSLWKGVPVVTLAGNTHRSRAGLSILRTVGLSDLVAETPEEYVRIAVALASDTNRLTDLRAMLRPMMANSPLRDEQGHTRRLEQAYMMMWQRYCAGGRTA